jgi:hypothetical protein
MVTGFGVVNPMYTSETMAIGRNQEMEAFMLPETGNQIPKAFIGKQATGRGKIIGKISLYALYIKPVPVHWSGFSLDMSDTNRKD